MSFLHGLDIAAKPSMSGLVDLSRGRPPDPGRAVLKNGIDLRLDEPVGVDEARYLHGGQGGSDIAEQLAVDRADHLPVLDASQHYARADDVGKRRPELLQGKPGNLEASPGLRSRIADSDRLAVQTDRGRARDTNDGPDAHRTGKTDQRLVRATGGDAQAFEVRQEGGFL